VRKQLILFTLGFIVWCLLNWVPDWQHIIVGLLLSVVAVVLTYDLFERTPCKESHPRRYWYFISEYLPIFLWEVLKANIDVAYRVLHPKLPLNPGIVKVKTTLTTDTGLTFLANSITLTPGTLTVDIDSDDNVLYIHCIDVNAEDVETATKDIVERFERILRKIFE